MRYLQFVSSEESLSKKFNLISKTAEILKQLELDVGTSNQKDFDFMLEENVDCKILI